MSNLLDLHLGDVQDPTIVPGGEEYELRIVDASIAPSKSSDRNLIKAMLEVIDHPTAKPIFVNFPLPGKKEEKKTEYILKLRIKDFLRAFGIDVADPGNPAEWKGMTAWAVLKETKREETGEETNDVARWIISK